MTKPAPLKPPLDYKSAGVDIDAGAQLVNEIKPIVAKTRTAGVMAGLGGFGAGFDIKAAGFKDPILIGATDGVGTKLLIARETARFDTIGIDLVAMCVNDVLCQGAKPLFFLDYFATGKLDVAPARDTIKGIAKGCEIAGCALIGGETAEMPDLYQAGDFDLAGFCLGALERGADLPRSPRAGDVLLGMASSGVHSNGYSLVRKVVERAGLGWDAPCPFGHGSLGEALLTPTRIYVADVLDALDTPALQGLAHITGGGLTENLPRVLPDGLGALVDVSAWQLPPVFAWLMEVAGISLDSALNTFNCGVGMVAVVRADDADRMRDMLAMRGCPCFPIGRVVAGAGVMYEGRG